jgi:hypothetical protein
MLRKMWKFGLGCLIAVGCGGSNGSPGLAGSAGSSGGQGDYSWSVTQSNTSGDMVSCVNYTHQKVSAAEAMTMVQGGTVSASPCPTASNIVGVCSGVDPGGNDYEQVFYNESGLTGTALSAGIANLMLSCSATSGTWSTTYDGTFKVGSGGGGGTGGGGSGGAAGEACARLLACCNATSAQLKPSCVSAYNAVNPNDTSCSAAYQGLQPTYCPGAQ